MSADSQVIEGEAEEIGAEVVHAAAAPPPTLFKTDDPAEVLKRAKATADALAPVIREAGLVSQIEGKDYLNVEAWQTLGQQVGVTGVIVSTRKLDNGWEARCEARTLDGRTIGAADSMCTRDETTGRKNTKRWEDANDFEIRSMAQTRAMSRALSSVLRFIPTLAGMGGTPAEEMERVRSHGGGDHTGFASDGQKGLLERLLRDDHGWRDEEVIKAVEYLGATQSGGRGGGISQTIDALMSKSGDEKNREALDWLTAQGEKHAGETSSEVSPAHDPTAEAHDENIPF